MATTKLGTTKVAARSLDYAENKAVIKSGLNLDIEYAKSQMRALREFHKKNDGVQAHTIIQSFKPGEVTPEQANEIGLELAKRVAGGHQVAIYTHNDTDHIHNHIVINSPDVETGRKYNSNAKQRHWVKEQNDEICRGRGLSVVREKTSDVRYTMAERALMEKGVTPWKEELRQVIEHAKEKSTNRQEFVDTLNDFGIEFKETEKNVSYRHPDQKKFVRGSTLGNLYDKGALQDVYAREIGKGEEKGSDWEQFESKVREAEPREAERADSSKITSDRERPQKQYGGTEKDTENAYKRVQQIRRESDELER